MYKRQEFMYLNALVPFEFCHIGKPFLIRFLRIELAVQQIFSKILRVLCPSGAAMVIVLYSGAYISGPADAQHSLVIDIDTTVSYTHLDVYKRQVLFHRKSIIFSMHAA